MESINEVGRFTPIAKAANLLGVSKQSLYNYHIAGNITLHKFAGKTFCDLEEVYAKMTPISRGENILKQKKG